MSSCKAFTVTVKNVEKAIKRAKDAIKKEGGTFKGDNTKGGYKVKGSGFITGKWSVEGAYAVSGNNVTIRNKLVAERPKIVSCGAAEDKIREFFK